MAAYVYGALAWGWGFNELVRRLPHRRHAAGLLGGLGLGAARRTRLSRRHAGLLPAAVLVGVARSIIGRARDGRVIDTILHGLATPLAGASAMTARC